MKRKHPDGYLVLDKHSLSFLEEEPTEEDIAELLETYGIEKYGELMELDIDDYERTKFVHEDDVAFIEFYVGNVKLGVSVTEWDEMDGLPVVLVELRRYN